MEKKDSAWIAGAVLIALLLAYLGGYGYVRHSFAIEAVPGSDPPFILGTGFDMNRRRDKICYYVFYPALKVDESLTGRQAIDVIPWD